MSSIVNENKTYLRGGAPKFSLTLTDTDGVTLLDADSGTQVITIYDANGNLMTTITTPTRTSLGNYYLFYTIPTGSGVSGLWRLDWLVQVQGTPGNGSYEFQVNDR